MHFGVVFATALAFILIVVAAPLVYSQEGNIPAPVAATSNVAPTSAISPMSPDARLLGRRLA